MQSLRFYARHAGAPSSRWLFTLFQRYSTLGPSDKASHLFSIQSYHKKLCNSPSESHKCRKIELEAWNCLQAITDEEVDGSAEFLGETLNAYVYFSNYWEKGINGPLISESDQRMISKVAPLPIPPATRDTTGPPRKAITTETALPPRANPLDEVLDF